MPAHVEGRFSRTWSVSKSVPFLWEEEVNLGGRCCHDQDYATRWIIIQWVSPSACVCITNTSSGTGFSPPTRKSISFKGDWWDFWHLSCEWGLGFLQRRWILRQRFNNWEQTPTVLLCRRNSYLFIFHFHFLSILFYFSSFSAENSDTTLSLSTHSSPLSFPSLCLSVTFLTYLLTLYFSLPQTLSLL